MQKIRKRGFSHKILDAVCKSRRRDVFYLAAEKIFLDRIDERINFEGKAKSQNSHSFKSSRGVSKNDKIRSRKKFYSSFYFFLRQDLNQTTQNSRLLLSSRKFRKAPKNQKAPKNKALSTLVGLHVTSLSSHFSDVIHWM